MSRDNRLRRQDSFDIEDEAAAAAEILRQRGNGADQFDILPFPRDGQFVEQTRFGPPGRPGDPEHQASHQERRDA